jgi:hypothetical protein
VKALLRKWAHAVNAAFSPPAADPEPALRDVYERGEEAAYRLVFPIVSAIVGKGNTPEAWDELCSLHKSLRVLSVNPRLVTRRDGDTLSWL